MSPALLNKYLQAAREVGDHMVLTPDGFDFAPHPMLVETDREKYAIQRIVRFLRAPAHRLRGLLPGRLALQAPVGARQARRHAGRHRGGSEGEPEVSADGLADSGGTPRQRSRGRPDREAAGDVARACRRRTQRHAERARKCVEMRDFVVRIRSHTAMQFAAPVVKGLPAGSQPLLNWKLRAVRLAPPRLRPEGSAQRHRPAAGSAGDPEVSRAAPGSGVRAGPR